MKIAQKFREIMTQKPAIALTSLLTLSSLLPFSNATAQEPMRTSHTPQSLSATHHRSTPIHDAMAYSKAHKGIGIMIAVGKEDTNKISGEQLGEMIKNYFRSEGIDSEVFTSLSSGKYTAIAYTVNGIPVSDEAAGLNEAKAMAVIAMSQYDDAYGTHLTRKPLSVATVTNRRE